MKSVNSTLFIFYIWFWNRYLLSVILISGCKVKKNASHCRFTTWKFRWISNLCGISTRGIRKSIQFVCFMPLLMFPSACHIPSSVYKDRKNSDLLQKNTNKFRHAQNIHIKYTNALHENHSAHAAGQMPLSARNPLIFRILHHFSRFPYKWLSFTHLTSSKIQGTYFKT